MPGEWDDTDTEFIGRKFSIYGLGNPEEYKARIVQVKPGDTVQIGPFAVEFVRVGHSIPDACGAHVVMWRSFEVVLFTLLAGQPQNGCRASAPPWGTRCRRRGG